VILPGDDPTLTTDLARLRAAVGTVEEIDAQRLATGTVNGGVIRAQDPRGAYGAPMLQLTGGRYPVGAGEVALTPDLARTYDVGLGAAWQGRRVVGLVRDPLNLLDSFALVAPGQLAQPDQVTLLFDGDAPAGFHVTVPGTPRGLSPAVVVLLVALFGLIFVGLVAVAGFSVLAQRRRRALGTLAAIGASEGGVRLVMVVNGVVVGVVCAVTGALAAIAAWLLYRPYLEVSAHHVIGWSRVPWWVVVAAMLLAVLTATLAAYRPAWVAARVSVGTAVADRPATPKPVHRSALPGAVLLGCGLVLLAFSGGWNSAGTKNASFKLLGLPAITLGVLLFAPACLTLLGRFARRTPIATRLALRDLARYRSRSGPALAAITFAVLAAVLIGLIATARYRDPLDYFGPNMAGNQMMVYPGHDHPGAVGQRIADQLGSTDPLALATSDAFLLDLTTHRGAMGTIYVATPDVLRYFGITSVDPQALLLTARSGLAATPHLALAADPEALLDQGCVAGARCAEQPRIQYTDRLPTGDSLPNLLVTERAVALLGLKVEPAAWLLRTPRALTDSQVNTARQAAAAAGATIETRSASPSLQGLRDNVTYGGIFIALAVLAMTVGLVRGEGARDLQTLAANGASPRLRRGITAVTAGALGLTGALIGTAVAYAAVLALFHAEISVRLGDPPIADLVLIVAGLPAAATVAAWLLAGREPATIARRAG
jgi:putative ABC transport system permease protein